MSLRCDGWRCSPRLRATTEPRSWKTCIFINYCAAHRCSGHISSNPSVSCTWKRSHMDGCALSPLSVCIRGEPFVCANPLSLTEVRHPAFHFPDIITGGELLCKFKHPWLGKMGRRFAHRCRSGRCRSTSARSLLSNSSFCSPSVGLV